ncbi:protein LAZY 1-like [Syzygium oleosum]|uniref:protein LAZY 1-like n=1 Tax=Syzygium oleosum TaxID=219896 RepID=UPI0011D1F7C5|nr:protein LAZY 1-like [Syzygium oleosum]
MKLPGWMHRKSRHNGHEPLKDFGATIGQPSLDDQKFSQRRSCGAEHLKQSQRELLRKSFACLESAILPDEEHYKEEPLAAEITDLFHGFLAIGTFGSEPALIPDPATPTFSYSLENITEKETEVTENDLKLINEELEKVLAAEANKDEWGNQSSGRNSHVSTGRSSHGSTITLGSKVEAQETNSSNGSAVCPLQGYLFGSAVEVLEAPKADKKDHRTSLGELFQRTKMTEEEYGCSKKDWDGSMVHFVKKKLKKKALQANPAARSSAFDAGTSSDSGSAETKLHKILHMFHKKVHPENAAAAKKSGEQQKIGVKKKATKSNGHSIGNQVLPEEDIVLVPEKILLKEKLRRLKSQSNRARILLTGDESNGNRECWIKTDADYLVLEL